MHHEIVSCSAARPPSSLGRALLVLLVLGGLTNDPCRAGGTPDPGTAISAGSTAEDQLLHVFGEARSIDNGDFVASTGTGGLNDAYALYVEVPPSQTRLQLELFDADLGAGSGGAGEFFDADITAFNTPVSYRLYDPLGNEMLNAAYGAQGCSACDNAWTDLWDSATPTPILESTSTTALGSNGNSITVTTPSGTSSGDYLLATISVDGNNAGAITPPAGWTPLLEGQNGGGGGFRYGLFSRVAGGSEPASYAFGWTNNNQAVAGILRFSGVDTTTPLDSGVYSTGTSNFPTAPSTAPTTAHTLVLRLIHADDDDTSSAVYPPKLSQVWDLDSNTGNGTTSMAASASALPPATASGAEVFDLDGTGNEIWIALTLPLRPAAGAGSVLPGHWRVEIDTTSAGGEDGNNFGIRAHDGDASASGTEYNLYAQSFVSLGEAAPGYTTNREYDLYPYVTAGCTVDVNDFDGDGNGDFDLATRAGISQLSNQGVSANNQWSNVSVTGWTDSDEASDYGLWNLFFDGFPVGGSNNVYMLYTGNELTADPVTSSPFGTPSAQPESGTYRIYLPADGSTYANGSGTVNAPTKPYLAQFLTHVNGMGSNPPTAGMTSRYAVTAQLANPTAFDLALDSSTAGSNVVTVVVPTSDPQITLVGGSTVVTQGTASVTTLGGGDSLLTWAPGTVAAGQTEAVFVLVDITPSAPFNSALTVTGTPASNGTAATWVDETCAGASCTGAQLSAATFTFGPLCELAVEPLAATPVMVSGLETHRTGAGVVVEWTTASEAASTSIELLRRQGDTWRPVEGGPRVPLLTHPAGGRYRLLDPDAPTGTLEYLLVEGDSLGRQTYHGPFRTTPEFGGEGGSLVGLDDGFEAIPHPPAAPRAGLAERRAPGGPDPGRPSPERRALRFALDTRIDPDQGVALTRLTAAEIAELAGESEETLRRLIARGQLRLARLGEDVAYRSLADGQALEWVAEAFETPFTDTLVYWLERGPATGFAPSTAPLPPLAPPLTAHFTERRRSERNLRAVTLLPLDPRGDLWFWDFLSAASPSTRERSFALELDDPAPDEGGTLTLHLQGAQAGLHRLLVQLEGERLGEVTVNGLDQTTPRLPIPAGVLRHGVNTVELVALEGGLVFVDAFTTDYARLYRARGDRLAFPGHGDEGLAIPGFDDPGVSVLDVTDPRRPRHVPHREVAGTTTDEGGWVVHLGKTEPGRRYLAMGPVAIASPTAARLDKTSNLLDTGQRADYLVVAPGELVSAAEELAALRRADGFETLVVDLQDIWDEMAFGLADPEALRDFFAWTHDHWDLPPHYVVLAGAGTYDYRDHLGLGGNLIPPLLTARDDSVFATDAPYADVVGDDGFPDLALGRIPVTTAEQLSAYIRKLAAMEAGHDPGLADDLLLVTDRADAAGDFARDGDRIAQLVPRGYDLHRLDYGGDRDGTRHQLFTELAEGQALALYLGHGGVDRLSSAGLLLSSDVDSLGGDPPLPLLAAISCHVALHALPGIDALGENLVLAESGGATAVWAPVWLSQHPQAIELGEELVRQLLHQDPPRLGEATRRALTGTIAQGLPRHLRETYQLLGDPALRLPLAPAPTDDDAPCTVDCGSS